MEEEDEINGSGSAYDFGARIYDGRLGKWMSLDPLMAKYTDLSPHNFGANNPIYYIDSDGRSFKPSNDFSSSRFGQVLVKILKNRSKLESISKYISHYLSTENNLVLEYHTILRTTTDGNNNKVPDVTLAGTTKLNIDGATIHINKANAFKTSNMEDIDKAEVRSELGMVSLLLHEMIYHGIRKSGDHLIGVKKATEVAQAMVDYADKIMDEPISMDIAVGFALQGVSKDHAQEVFQIIVVR